MSRLVRTPSLSRRRRRRDRRPERDREGSQGHPLLRCCRADHREDRGRPGCVERPNDERTSRSLHGLSRTLIANMIVGVTEGYKKDLEITGTGYRVVAKGKDLEFSLASPTRSPLPRPRASSSRLRRSPRRCSRCPVSTSSSSARLLLASAS